MLPSDGADVVFDAAGAIDSPRELLRRGGQLVEVGWPARDLKSAELRSLFFHGVTIINSRIRHSGNVASRIAMVSSGAVDLVDGHTSLFYPHALKLRPPESAAE